MKYIPAPLDTSATTLPADIIELREKLARNTHDIWARDRMAQGWTWGPRRDDEKRQNPCLVPYEDLPESEREYDRNTAMETLKAICAVGFRIEKN
jgi:RyR domain